MNTEEIFSWVFLFFALGVMSGQNKASLIENRTSKDKAVLPDFVLFSKANVDFSGYETCLRHGLPVS